MSEEKKIVELTEDELRKVSGGSSVAPITDTLSGEIVMITSTGREINTVNETVTRTDTSESFFVTFLSNNTEPGCKTGAFSTTYYFASCSSTAFFFFTAFKNGNVICSDVK